MTGPESQQGPYGSFRDLPSYIEMAQMVRTGKLLTRIVARETRPDLVRIEAEMVELADLVDEFYHLLGPRNWIFHDQLSTATVSEILGANLPAHEAEAHFISLYRDPETLDRMVRALHRFDALRIRSNHIDRAVDHYHAERFDSCTLTLITVMDGFVNDVDRAERRGLHARDPDEMAAWDSVVGHHQGLYHAHQSFTRTIKKNIEEEVHELYRHGIVHGMVLNYDNPIVATKAWNRLFAVADWATAREKQRQPVEPEPKLRDMLDRLAKTRREKERIEAWRPSSFTEGDPGLQATTAYQVSHEYLDAWKNGNYGRMAARIAKDRLAGGINKAAGEVRERYEDSTLSSFAIRTIDHTAPAVAEVVGSAVINGETRELRLRWLRHDDGGRPVVDDDEGRWVLFVWDPWALLS